MQRPAPPPSGARERPPPCSDAAAPAAAAAAAAVIFPGEAASPRSRSSAVSPVGRGGCPHAGGPPAAAVVVVVVVVAAAAAAVVAASALPAVDAMRRGDTPAGLLLAGVQRPVVVHPNASLASLLWLQRTIQVFVPADPSRQVRRNKGCMLYIHLNSHIVYSTIHQSQIKQTRGGNVLGNSPLPCGCWASTRPGPVTKIRQAKSSTLRSASCTYTAAIQDTQSRMQAGKGRCRDTYVHMSVEERH